MAGITHFKKGKHPSRDSINAQFSGKEFADLYSQILILLEEANRPRPRSKTNFEPKPRPKPEDILQLANAITIARANNLRARACAVTPNDIRQQLQSMQALNEHMLIDALRNCDQRTLLEINEAQESIIWEIILTNGFFVDTKGKEHTSSSHPISFDHSHTPPYLPLGVEGTRKSIQKALEIVSARTETKGRRYKSYYKELACESTLFWAKHTGKPRSPGRLAFMELIFNAANIYLSPKRLEALITSTTRKNSIRSN